MERAAQGDQRRIAEQGNLIAKFNAALELATGESGVSSRRELSDLVVYDDSRWRMA